MAVLVLDTATEVLAAGVASEEEVSKSENRPELSVAPRLTASTAIRVPRGHSRLLQPAMKRLLDETGTDVRDLSAIGVGVGPGSYTGVRLGVTTAKTMGFALRIPVYPLSTLEAMAAANLLGRSFAHSRFPWRVTSLLYARRGRAFGGVYEYDGGRLVPVIGERVLSMEKWALTLEEIRTLRGEATEVAIHDFLPKYGLEAALDNLRTGLAVSLADCAGNLPQGLLRVLLGGAAQKLEGRKLHALEPAYTLEVEAQVKLKEATQYGHVEK